jgi:OmcA/MtrC family decaheme c-type cytochrome
MHSHLWKRIGAMCLAGTLALAGCSGDDGTVGPPGAPGTDGTDGTDGMSAVTGKLRLVIDGVASATANSVTTSTITFTVYPAGAVCPGTVCSPNLSVLKQKTFYATEYDPATKTFPTAKSFSFTGITFKGLVDGGKGAQYTASRSPAGFAPEASAHAMIYGYIGDAAVITPAGHYQLLDNVASASKVYGTIDYASNANVSGCEKCHVAPYSKHGYRQARVAGLPDLASCKACHTDQRGGTDQLWQILADDPASYLTTPVVDGELEYTADQLAKYAYTANIMNDTHMSHAMEFAYPQSMANCVTCHEGKLTAILADANFTLKTCKSCHPVTGVGGTAAKRAPALLNVITDASYHAAARANLYTFTGSCNGCHAAGGVGPTFAAIHPGFSAAIYADGVARFADTVKAEIGTITKSGNVLTVPVTMTGVGATDLVEPTVVVSLYGYGTKDFVVSGHGSRADGTRNLEWTEGACQRGTGGEGQPACVPANNAALDVTPLATAGNASWTATVDLSTWATLITDGVVKRVEVAFLPSLGTKAVTGATKTFDLVAGAEVADAYGKEIVDPAKCNKCHDALGTTFHEPSYGSAGVVGCRLCHVVGSGGSHLEMQSRSIDSYVHALHSMQAMDVAAADYTDPVREVRHEFHVEGTYPTFSLLHCESCHNPGTYEVPDQTRSLPSLLSASTNGLPRTIGNVPAYAVGPASRACGSCHRSEFIIEDDAAGLAAFNEHTGDFGTLVVNGAGVLDAVTQSLLARLGGPAFTGTTPAGTQIESCSICHPGAGKMHQDVFNKWATGL